MEYINCSASSRHGIPSVRAAHGRARDRRSAAPPRFVLPARGEAGPGPPLTKNMNEESRGADGDVRRGRGPGETCCAPPRAAGPTGLPQERVQYR